ncbi:hypothetical protein [Moorena sp. SIO3I8]|uniref:hypothetical protein n=1 Tax=Moorena sp. SIO3I8 TaxID=2607833 RepID=UPI0013C28BDD|nr:hypothetical protein [Moorena sp. SIO3I8]NEO07463.1 hypothetical protein [Moorena sp. SIO3I8]
MGRWGDREMGRWGDGEMGRWGDREIGRWGDREMGRIIPAIIVYFDIYLFGRDSTQ